jgi:leucyl-tRNA synthetase
MHTAIKKVSNDIDNIKFNTAIASIMSLVNDIYKVGKINKAEYKTLLTILMPWAPHIVSELWQLTNMGGSVEDACWPQFDEAKLVKSEIEIPVQVNGKLTGVVMASVDASQDELVELAKQNEGISEYLVGTPKKIIYVPKKIFNIII